MTSRLRLVAAAALTLAVLPLGATASAETWTHTDARRDASRVVTDLTTGEEQRSAAPGEKAADVTRLAVRHQPRTLRLKVGVRDLPRRGSSSVLAHLVTPAGPFVAMVERSPDSFTFVLMSLRGEEDQVSCSGGAGDFDAAKDTITIAIPRSCLADPAWVRAGVLVGSGGFGFLGGIVGEELPETITSTYDDALRDGGRPRDPKLGPKVRVG